MQKSDAGVGIGTLIGDRDSLARKEKSWFDLPHFRFMFFHIQAFQEIPPAKLIPGDSSSSTFHDFIILSYSKIKNKNEGSQTKKNLRLGTQDFRKF